MDRSGSSERDAGLILHVVRLVGFADVEAVVHRTGFEPERVRAPLQWAEQAGLVRSRVSPSPGWTITEEGRRHVAEWIASELDAITTAEAERIYERFLPLNAEFLDACRRWQLIDTDAGPVPNRHDDPDYDRAAAAAIVERVERVEELLAALGRHLDRFGRYTDRFAVARRRVLGGEHDFITRPLVDSCHTIWFEVHEDLLATTGRTRSSERRKG